jgi:predicted DNA-binding transcriptional regulator YafY
VRADRLVATLLLLQARGKVTTAEVAEELEVSTRTARRDLDALSVAGIPVYSQQGRGGGWSLIGGATTDLTGFRSVEARALLTMAAAAGAATPEFSTAMQKLVQALPAPMRDEARRVTASVLADEARWGNPAASVFDEPRRDEHLEPLQRAVIEQRPITLTYDTPRSGVSSRRAEPLGLVIKRSVWYLLADTAKGPRSFRVDRVVSVDVLDGRFERPDDFDLGAAWSRITTEYESQHRRFEVRALLEPWTVPALRALGVEVALGREEPDGRRAATLGGMSVEVLAAEIAGVMHGIELIDAPQIEAHLGRIGTALAARFGDGGQVGDGFEGITGRRVGRTTGSGADVRVES